MVSLPYIQAYYCVTMGMVKACLTAGADKNIRVNNRTPEDLVYFLIKMILPV